MWSGDQLIKRMVGGDAASFQPLAQLQPRQMSAKALGSAQVLRIDRRLLDKFLSLANEEVEEKPSSIEVEEFESTGALDWLTSMLQSELFARIPPANIQRLIDTLEAINVTAGEVVIQQGNVGDYYYIVQTGRCEVCRATRAGKQIKLAELGPGDTFGEEALVSNTKRNATVRMLSDGVLGRLTQEHFIELIREPLLRSVSLAKAREMVDAGARWLDVRFPEEHAANGLSRSFNLPLSFLRTRFKELAPEISYVAYCDTGGRSSAAAFLLTQEGYDICFVATSAIDELLTHPIPPIAAPTAAVSPAPAEVPAQATSAQRREAMVDAEVHAQSLAAEVERAHIQIAHAQQLVAEAEAAKREAAEYVAQQVGNERARIQQEEAAVRAKLEEAGRLKNLLEQQHAAASAEAARQRKEHAARAQLAQERIERALQEKEARLEEVFRQQAQQLEQLQVATQQERRSLNDTW
ncbi:MAG: cyclic nucleotide-binding domain-containing protein [Gammaproteobacteria bacterium]|nr:cyclic nucleotide-binding domain-containing protein [Gammaproteobacteria bacterium]